jgi:hypothetical protein
MCCWGKNRGGKLEVLVLSRLGKACLGVEVVVQGLGELRMGWWRV